MQWGDSQGYDTGITALSSDIAGNVTTPITLAGPGLEQFIADAPTYPGMTYDEINDQFVFYCGMPSGAEGRLYFIKPNLTSKWLICVQALGVGTEIPVGPPSSGSGINKRIGYSKLLGGLWLVPKAASNVYFIRTI